MIFEAKNISKNFNGINVISNVDISIQRGEIISIQGSSGSGKTTLLNILGLIDKPSSGVINYYNNLQYDNFNSPDRVNTIGYIFQFHHLLSEFKVIDNLIIPQLMSGRSYDVSLKNAKEMLALVGLKSLSDRSPNAISGGERQRIAVIRGIINKPDIVFADEPTGNLDDDNSMIIIKLLNDLKDNFNISFVIATHDKQVTKFSKESFYIANGKIEKGRL